MMREINCGFPTTFYFLGQKVDLEVYYAPWISNYVARLLVPPTQYSPKHLGSRIVVCEGITPDAAVRAAMSSAFDL